MGHVIGHNNTCLSEKRNLNLNFFFFCSEVAKGVLFV